MNKTAPLSTYRLQLNRDFNFNAAIEILDYLKNLGISTIYCSPIFLAPRESTHGYDQCNPQIINTHLGGEAGFVRLCDEAQKLGLSVIVDFVPNHMVATTENPFWEDVLKEGPSSKFAKVFDINWDLGTWIPKVTIPVLGDLYGRVLARGEFKITQNEGRFELEYFEHKFPINSEGARYLQSLKKTDVANHLNSSEGRELLHRLLEMQYYKLRHWKEGSKELNYRRFFAINTLAGVNVQEPEVLELMHGKLKEILVNGQASGVRVDHIDGLADPEGYLAELSRISPYVVVEKILSGDERLRRNWPVQGTTGYEFATAAIRLFTKAENEVTEIYQKFAGEKRSFEQIMEETKAQALTELFPSEMERFVTMLHRVALSQLEYSDISRQTCAEALTKFIVHLPVYRTYIGSAAGTEDRAIIEETIKKCKAESCDVGIIALELIQKLLTGELSPIAPELNEPDLPTLPEVLRAKLQQFTGAATAKGIEDTAFFIYNRLNALNDVGAEPGLFSITPGVFHEKMEHQASTFSLSMLATSTHDSKVSEDVRCRLTAISHFAAEWNGLLQQVPLISVPSRNDQYLFYQMLIGTWPLEGDHPQELKDRLANYMIKAIREAAVHTRWTDVNEEYEQQTKVFVQKILGDRELLASISPFANKVAEAGAMVSLQQLVLKLTAPGVPDIYQGNEIWDFSLVDPDNRRPVDYKLRSELLGRAAESDFSEMMKNWKDGRIKIWITRTLLDFRRTNPDLFLKGSYARIEAGEAVAFRREHEGRQLVVYVKASGEIPETKGMKKVVGGGAAPFGVFYR